MTLRIYAHPPPPHLPRFMAKICIIVRRPIRVPSTVIISEIDYKRGMWCVWNSAVPWKLLVYWKLECWQQYIIYNNIYNNNISRATARTCFHSRFYPTSHVSPFLPFVLPLQRSTRTRHCCTNTARRPARSFIGLLRPFGNGFSAGYFSILAAAVIKRARAPSGNADARRSARSRTRHNTPSTRSTRVRPTDTRGYLLVALRTINHGDRGSGKG